MVFPSAITGEPPNNESFGTANYKCIEVYANDGTWEKFIMRGFSLLGGFIIGGSTVH